MDLPALEAGMAILASQINNITREVRSNAVTSMIGGQFVRTTGGTSLIVGATTQSSGASVTECPFRVTPGDGLKVDVAFGRLIPSQRIPDGMSMGTAPNWIPTGVTLTVTEGTSFIYLRSEFDETYINLKNSQFVVETEVQANTTIYVYALQAVVHANNEAVTKVDNTCQNYDPSACSLDWSTPLPPP